MDAYHIVCARGALSAGEQVEVRLEPAPPPGTYIYWRNAQQIGMNPAAAEAGRAVYTAPFVIRPGSPPAEIRVDLSGPQTGRVGFVGRVDLVPSVLPLTSYDDNRQPIEHERALTEAAVAIASSRIFSPLLRDGTPAAGWIHVHVTFRP